MSYFTATTNPNINLTDHYCPPTSRSVCFWSPNHEIYANIKTDAILGVEKDFGTGLNYLIVENPTATKESRVDVREPRVQVGQSINRSKKLIDITKGGV